jgi:hypothetical protein
VLTLVLPACSSNGESDTDALDRADGTDLGDDGTDRGDLADGPDGADPAVILELPGVAPGEIISLRGNGTAVEWINRLDGQILRIDDATEPADPSDVRVVATVEVGTEGEQRGLLGTAVIGTRRFAAWTRPDTFEVLVGELIEGAPPRIVWDGGGTAGGAVGGHLDVYDGRLLIGLGQLTDFAKDRNAARPSADEADVLAELVDFAEEIWPQSRYSRLRRSYDSLSQRAQRGLGPRVPVRVTGLSDRAMRHMRWRRWRRTGIDGAVGTI